MKAKNISTSLALAVLTVVLVSIPRLQSDVGGGSGKPITPYKSGSKITEEIVTRCRDQASTSMAVEEAHIAGSHATRSGFNVGFAYVAKDGKLADSPRFSFQGSDQNGQPVTIPLAAIDSFRLVKVNKRLMSSDEAELDITEFPALTPGELLAKKPTYTDLLKKYKRVLHLRAPLQDSSGNLALVGTDWYNDNDYRVVFAVRDLEPGTEVKLMLDKRRGNGLWWAIESVTQDKNYPHRVIMKK